MRRVRWLVVGLVVAIGLAFFVWKVLFPVPDVPHPFDVEAFVSPGIPDEENAAVLIREAISWADLEMIRTLRDDIERGDKPLALIRGRMIKVLDRHADVLARLREGLARPKSYFDTGPKPSFLTELGFLDDTPALVSLLEWEGQGRLADGDAAGALESYLDVIRLACALEPGQGAGLYRAGARMEGRALEAIQNLIRGPTATPAMCRRTVSEVGRLADRVRPASDWIKAEYVYLINTIGMPLPDGMDWNSFDESFERLMRLRGWAAHRFKKAAVAFTTRMLALATQPTHHVLAPGQADSLLAQPADDEEALLAELQMGLTGMFQVMARRRTCLQLTRLLAAVRGYELEKGTPPPSLDKLVPAYLQKLPPDAYDGKPLRLTQVDGKWIIYSVGKDLKDDGGQSDNLMVPVHRGAAAESEGG